MKLNHFDDDLQNEAEKHPFVVARVASPCDVVVKEYLFVGLVKDDQIVYNPYRWGTRDGSGDEKKEWWPMKGQPDQIIGVPFEHLD
ncbi:MAG TPA: hypothetical protein DCQ92_05840 [Verrucomicrobia subdivision 3 bacterium]|nr:hypothetical protein [Limisphaerales bacterium]